MIGRELPYYQGQVRSFIYESKGNGQDFCDKLLDQIRVKEDFLMIDMVCDELSAAFKNMTSQVVSNATYMVNYLARGGVEVLTMRMAQKQFQENLVYTLRGKTSLLGNKLTIHPLVWEEIENRVLSLYQYWFASLCQEENKYHHILEKYRYLKSMNLRFPPMDISTPQKKARPVKQNQVEVTQTIKPVESAVSEQQFALIDELIVKYEDIIDRGEINKLLNNETVRMVKGKVTQLYTIFTTKKLEEQPKERVKGQYSKLRAILKKMDQANDYAKLEQERRFVEQKKAAVTGKPLSQKLIGTPQKQQEVAVVLNLFDEQPAPTKPPQNEDEEFTAFQSGEQIPESLLTPEKKTHDKAAPPSPSKPNNGQLLFDAIEQFQQEQKLEQEKLERTKKQELLIDTSTQPPQPVEPVKQIPNELQL